MVEENFYISNMFQVARWVAKMVHSGIGVSLSRMIVLHNLKTSFINDTHTGGDILGCIYKYFYVFLSQVLAKVLRLA